MNKTGNFYSTYKNQVVKIRQRESCAHKDDPFKGGSVKVLLTMSGSRSDSLFP